MNDAPVLEGDILAGKYRVERVLGVGGMGVVVAATHIQLEERVALKFLIQEAVGNGEAVARFAREARAAVKIKSEHVARVIDVGTLETGAPYMVMEYLQGADLSQVLQAQGSIAIEDAVEYVLQACEAIAEAHVLGIIHRDLKPANLFLIRRPDGSNSIKVLDFGISKVMPGKGSSSDAAMTRTRAVMGSPLYMSPEQMASSRDVDGRTDLWALGAILYELIVGQPPFVAESMPQLCALILNGPTPSLRAVIPNAPWALEAVVRRCLEKDPLRRYPNIAEFAMALGDFAPRRARASVDRISRIIQGANTSNGGVILGSATGSFVQTGKTWAETKGSMTRSSRKVVWGGVVIAALLLIGGIVVARRSAVTPAVSGSDISQPSSGALAAPVLVSPPLVNAVPPPPLSATPTLPAPTLAPATPSLGPPSESNITRSKPDVPSASTKPEPFKAAGKKALLSARPNAAPPSGAAAPPAAAPTPPKPAPAGDLFDDRK